MTTEDPQTVTYRGRSLEEVLPKIREELGPDAVIERQRAGLVGGVGGFFQREMIEVDARPAAPGEHGTFDVLAGSDADEAALRAATAPAPDPDRDEGLTSPAMRRIAEQAEPFAELLADAESDADQRAPAPPARDWDAWAAEMADDEEDVDEPEDAPPSPFAAPPTPPAPAYRPPAAGRHALEAYQRPGRVDDPALHEPLPAPAPPAERGPSSAGAHPLSSDPFAGGADEGRLFAAPPPERGARPRPAAAGAYEATLTGHGLSAELAASVVGEAVSHAGPFAGARGSLKKQVRATLARRLPVQAGFGGAGRTIALVGAAGAGKTRAVAGLAAVYAAGSDLPVVVLSLRPADVGAELRELLDPHGVSVRPVADGAAARAHIGARAGQALVLLDTPAASPRDGAAIARLAEDLREAQVTEAHVVLPATVAGPVARETVRAFAPVAPAALLVTHADETDHLGTLVDLSLAEGRPISYLAAPDPSPVDPAALAARLLP